MAGKKDYYRILGIDKKADAAEIKKAYRKMAKRYHPDTNSGNADAEQKFKEVTEAYNILSDPEKRKIYDQWGSEAFDGGDPRENWANSAYGKNTGGMEFHFEGDPEDLFGDFFGDIFGKRGFSGEDVFEKNFHRNDFYEGSQRQSHGFSKDGENVTSEITVSFEEAAFGGEKTIRFQGEDGNVQTLKVTIPAGIEEGKSLRLRGKGRKGKYGGRNGDLLLKVKILPKPGFERKGMDIYSTIRIPFITAVLGGEVQVSTLYGPVLCKIKEGIQSGTKIRLKGKGVPAVKDMSRQGDQYVTIQIDVPQNLTEEAKRKLKEFELLSRKGNKNSAA